MILVSSERTVNMSDLTVARTILNQLGGTGRLFSFVGANSFVGSDNSVTFRFKARATNGSNALRVVLDPSDTYTVEFISIRGTSVKVKESFSDIYADTLVSLFERKTGLYLSFGGGHRPSIS